jgi:FAD binding domain/Berberine and berberine like
VGAVETATVEELRSSVGGEVIAPEDPSYDQARRVWNGRIDRNPALIVSCRSTEDVVAAVNFGRDNDLLVAVRGGAHSTPGHSTCDGGIVIDLGPMKGVAVDPEARTAKVQGGAKWLDVDGATQEHGLAVTGGRVSDTGVGGLALGSGSGWLERIYGITAESLIGAEVVVADGSVVRAGADENPDLLWGLRGGGGNFGVVTEFEFRLHPVGPIVAGGMLLYPRSRAREVIHAYRDFMEAAPDQVCGGLALITAPPEEFVPEELRGQPATGIVYCYVGRPDEGEQALAPLKAAVTPALDLVQPMPYAALQQMLDAGNPTGIREYFKIDWLKQLPDEAVEVVLEHAERMPVPFAQIILAPMGGAVSRTDNSALALTVPDVPWAYFSLTMWMDPDEDDRNVAWTRGFAEAMGPFGIGREALPNFIPPGEDRSHIRDSYGENYARLVELKRAWDPSNLFRLNQNIDPAES